MRLDLTDVPVLVVGGDAAALTEVVHLREQGARVTVAADALVAGLEDLVDRHLVRRVDAGEALGLVPGARLVVDARPRDDTGLRAAVRAAGVPSCAPVSESADRDLATAGDERTEGAACGSVVLVGGGPGDPGLLTRAGYEALLGADVVVADRLAPLGVLADLPRAVEVVDVAKIPRGRFTPQEEINDILVREARKGRRVVRLKGGDPYVFGRGYEELVACRAAGVPVEVVPGVTSAVSVPELAGIPVTNRGTVQGFTVVSGHTAPGDPRSTVDWDALARCGTTLVVLMGVETLPSVARALREAGRADDTPLACVMDGGLPSMRVVRTTLGAVCEHGLPDGVSAPAVTVVGDVAALEPGAPAGARERAH